MKELLAGIALALLISWYDIARQPQEYLVPVPERPRAVQEEDEADPREERLEAFLESYHSPLAEHSGFLIRIADTYGLDYRLLPSIAGAESTFCKFIPDYSYNCFGWGIYGGKVTRFPNYKLAI